MASNGLIVVAVEHRDGSGARSYVNLPGNKIPPEADKLGVTSQNLSYKIDYIFPKGNAQDTSPNNARGVDVELRNAQIEMRMAEIEEAYHVLQLINNGHGEMVYEANLRRKGNVGSSSKGLDNIDWPDWEGRMFLYNVTAMGHSFGGATTVEVVRQRGRFSWVGQGILLDVWGPATSTLGEATHESLQKPILAINSEAFMHWSDNFQKLVDICKEARSNNAPCWMLTVKGSTHLSQSDFAVLYPHLMSLLTKTIVNPRRAVYLTVNSCFEFLKRVLPPEQTLGNNWPDEGILSTKYLDIDELPNDYKPNEKWMAARLKIPNESRLRLKLWFGRKPKAPKVATDIHGKPLVGIVAFAPGNEVWMHCSPNSEDYDLEHPKPVKSASVTEGHVALASG
jgi:platelet-activating factor acetylhydrolase